MQWKYYVQNGFAEHYLYIYNTEQVKLPKYFLPLFCMYVLSAYYIWDTDAGAGELHREKFLIYRAYILP